MLKRRLLTFLCSGLLTSLALAGNAGKPDETITLSGLVFQFNTSNLLAGARVTLAELPLEQYPDMVATSQADGSFVLYNVPSGIKVTPKVELAGFQTMHHQTFETKKKDIEMVYLQTVPLQQFQGIVGWLVYYQGVPVDLQKCQVVTTVTDPYMDEIKSWEEYTEFHPHGLAGARASITPSDASAIYFAEPQAAGYPPLPSVALTQTSSDGGVVWVNLEPGEYIITATHADDGIEFPEPRITCTPGRFVNASPPWGLSSEWLNE